MATVAQADTAVLCDLSKLDGCGSRGRHYLWSAALSRPPPSIRGSTRQHTRACGVRACTAPPLGLEAVRRQGRRYQHRGR